MSSLSPPSSPPKTMRNAKNAVITALTTLSIVSETVPIPGAKVPAVALLELIKALEKMKVNTEALDQLHQSLLELIAILEKTKITPNVSEDLQQNIARLFEKISSVAHQWSELRAQKSRFLRFVNRDDISADIAKLNEDIRAACATFVIIASIDSHRSIGATQDAILNTRQAVGANHREIVNTQRAVEVGCEEIIRTVGDKSQEIINTVEVKHHEAVFARHLDKLPRVDEAQYDHASRQGAPTCVPGSRDALLEKIHRWATNLNEESSPIFWLSGIAGAGKSTVAQTVCVNATELKSLGGTFFFSHQEGQRHIANAVFPTLVHQLLSNPESHTSIKNRIFDSLEKNPSAASKLLQTQFEKLIVEPLHNLKLPSPVILVLDALDECTEDGAKEVLRLITSNLDRIPSFLKIFVTSRPESHIADFLNPKDPKAVKHNSRVYQHEIDPSSDDNAVRAFFETALSTLEVARLFPAFAGWSLTEEQMNRLVKITEGLFIVAATIVKFILNPADANPEYTLSVLLEDPELKVQTHSAINLLYIKVLEHRYTLSTRRPTLDLFRKVVGSIILLFEPLSVDSLSRLLELTSPTINSALHRLQSVVAVTQADGLARPLHPSFIDFLTSPRTCPPQFLVKHQHQHALLAQRCIAILNRLFDNGRKMTEEEITPEVAYALCYLDGHIKASSPEYKEEFLGFIKSFVSSQVAKWLVALFHAHRTSYAIHSAKQLCEWVTNGFPSETELAAQLKDLKWCIAQFYEDQGRHVAELGQREEASQWWSVSEKAYLQLCATKEDFLRETIFHLTLDGCFETIKRANPQEYGVDESKCVVEELVTHRCGLLWRHDTTQQFLHNLDGTLYSHQQELAIYTTQHRISILRTMGPSFQKPLALALHNQGFNLNSLGQCVEAVEVAEEAARLLYILFDADPEAYRANLSSSLYNLGIFRSNLKRWQGAADVMGQAVKLRQVLFDADPETYRSSLSNYLHSLGYYRAELKQWQGASEITDQAVKLRQVLFAADPETHRSNLSKSLHSLGYYLSELKQWESAVEAMIQAVALRQVLFDADQENYRSLLSNSLYDLATYYSKLEQWTAASQVMERAVIIREVLYASAPHTHSSDLAEALHFLEFFQLEAGEQSGAAKTLGRIKELQDILVTSDSNAQRVALASPGNELAWFLRESKRPQQGLKYVLDAVNIIRAAPSPNELEVIDCLSGLLDTAAACLHDADHSAEALAYSEESVALARSSVQRAPSNSSYRINLLKVMETYSNILKTLGQAQSAEEVFGEMKDIRMQEP